eukprot:CAMPEP_0179149742 /NCGR_PEP_ID=MMETSP0796-20121207/72564_1 /TAXON_ID=73915 /ORGANISM="Pyrodinium bahamense, Strain pbaha01" /LENGTH=37 /DNA_ID= /DNA_START= /DNA_END= /DNA_ORIENTATION=
MTRAERRKIQTYASIDGTLQCGESRCLVGCSALAGSN